jgi:hypothetical protein
MNAATSPWNSTLTAAQLEIFYAVKAKLDPAFARRDRAFWNTRTKSQLKSLKAGAWEANDATVYQMANTYLTLA